MPPAHRLAGQVYCPLESAGRERGTPPYGSAPLFSSVSAIGLLGGLRLNNLRSLGALAPDIRFGISVDFFDTLHADMRAGVSL